ncbi:hypothetical protein PSTG_08199 [Puccinia striiformis f. sp. tritici PST-78]|uniref:Uncharacterized protein n=1 Tax=Puccinia striiformis f. sp. tritici PST-78 TaxID=1165861 RepID=A0A0L0VGS2_9BASI|nr:hypothetical protein PSTG_08199 [Puccinia striiformis f. sp. tritici PST-78]
MVEATEPTPSSADALANKQSISQKRDCIYLTFRIMVNMYDSSDDWPTEQTLPINRASWKAGISRLQSKLLPSLRCQITTLSRILNSSDLQNDQGPKFDLILKIQSELGRTFDDLISRAGNTDPESVSFRAQTNDNDLQEIKGFRLWVLRWNIVSLTHHLRRLFDFSSNVILELQPPPLTYRRQASSSDNRKMVTESTTETLALINRLMKWVYGNEFSVILERWQIELDAIDTQLANIIWLICLTTQSDKEDPQSEITELSEPIIHLAQSTIPVFKLSRLFFRKSTRSGSNQTRFESFSEMSSHQLGALYESAGEIADHLCRILKTLSEPEEYELSHITAALIHSVEHLLLRFDSYMLLLILYVVPVTPEWEDPSSRKLHLKTWLVNWHNLFLSACKKTPEWEDPSSRKLHLKTWLVNWHNLFLSACKNCIRVAQSFETDE